MLGLSQRSGYMTILALPHESCRNLEADLTASYWTLSAALKKTTFTSTQVSGLCSAWASLLRQNGLWYWGRTPLTVPKLEVHSGKFYRELSSLLTTANLTLPDFVMWRVNKSSGLIRCLPPTVLMNVLDAMALSNYQSN